MQLLEEHCVRNRAQFCVCIEVDHDVLPLIPYLLHFLHEFFALSSLQGHASSSSADVVTKLEFAHSEDTNADWI